MKKMMFTMALMVAIVTSASAMTFNEAREHAMFLTDKMSYPIPNPQSPIPIYHK